MEINMNLNLQGHTALVTGSAKRVGRVIALELAKAGASVAVHYYNSDAEAEQTVSEIRQLGAKAESFRADLSDAGETSRLVDRINESLGPVSILVNSASEFSKGELSTTTVEEWDRYFRVNVTAPFLLAQAMQRALADGQTGKVINLNDWRTARPSRFAYGASKAALSGLTRSLAAAMAPNIQVNELALGAILPPADLKPQKPGEAFVEKASLAGRMGTPDLMADYACLARDAGVLR